MTVASPPARLAHLITQAKRSRSLIQDLETTLQPDSKDDAYLTQQEILRLNSWEVGGWKVGSKSIDGAVQGSPLPRKCLFKPGQTFNPLDFPPVGLELEIAFRFKRDFAPRDDAYSEEEVLAGIGEMAATIEIVSSRFAAFPRVEPLTQLADLLNHGALIIGECVPYEPDFDFVKPSAEFTLEGESIVFSTVANPAGDPRRLLTWLVNHYTSHGQTLPAKYVITTGSYTGMHFAKTSGNVKGKIQGLPPVSLTLS